MPGPVPSSRTLRELDGQVVLAVQSGRLAPARGRRVGSLKIWDIATGREIAATALTGVPVQVARFSADGKRLAVAGLVGQLLTGEVRILDAEDAREVWSLKGHTLPVLDVAFSPDGHRLATDQRGPDGPALGPDRGAGDPEAGRRDGSRR